MAFWASGGTVWKERNCWRGSGQDVIPSVGRGREEKVIHLLCIEALCTLFHLALSVHL